MIRSGRDIFALGEVVQTPQGGLRIVGVHRKADYVEYDTEPVVRRVLSHHQPLGPLGRARAASSRVVERFRRWRTK